MRMEFGREGKEIWYLGHWEEEINEEEPTQAAIRVSHKVRKSNARQVLPMQDTPWRRHQVVKTCQLYFH